MEKAIEIKRRAQRCIQNGDLDGALSEYEKLVAVEDSDPYNLVLLADLLFKKADTAEAGRRYLEAAASYEKAGLYKNAIAVCKKLMRLQLAPSQVFQRLATLHALDGLSTEASLYFQQHAENLARDERYNEASQSLRQAFDTSHENVKALERLAEIQLLLEHRDEAVLTLLEAAEEYGKAGQLIDAERCRRRAHKLDPSTRDQGPEDAGDVPASLAGAALDPGKAVPRHDQGFGSTLELDPAMVIEPAIDHLDFEISAPPETDVDAPKPGIRRLSDLESTSRKAPPGPSRPAATRPANRVMAPAPGAPPATNRAREAEAAVPEDAVEEPGLNGEEEFATPGLESAAAIHAPAVDEDGDASERVAEADPDAARGEAPAEAEADDAESTPRMPDEIPDDARHEPIELGPAPRAAVTGAGTPTTGLRFETPGAPAAPPVASLGDVERMLTRAQGCFRAGQREAASEALAAAAQAYDALGRFDSAATIYRSLGKSAHATIEMLERWIENCERRGDLVEAAQVACELGDGALNDGQTVAARSWFERAREFDASNEVSLRRLQRMSGAGVVSPGGGDPAGPAGAGALEALSSGITPKTSRDPGGAAAPGVRAGQSGNEPGRVEVAVGRGEAVTFDLGSLIAEFQRGVETQLSGDAQSHYDLGMSYREMGLLEQAVDSFRVAAADPAYGLRAMEMVGRCLLDQGRFDEAIEEFESGLSCDGLDAMARISLHYEIGLAHEAAGRPQQALKEFERVHAERPDFSDVRLKLRALRKTPGSA